MLRARGLVVALLALGLVAGCGGSAGADRLPAADDPVAWAGRVCASLQPLSALKGHGPALDPNNPAASKQVLSAYFADTEQRAEQSLNGLDQAGPSPIAGGDDVTAKLRASLQRLRAAYAEAKQQVDAIDADDPVALGSRLPEIFTALSAAADKDLQSLDANRELNDAVKQAPSCSLIPAAGAAAAN
jgi:hypothetical protein